MADITLKKELKDHGVWLIYKYSPDENKGTNNRGNIILGIVFWDQKEALAYAKMCQEERNQNMRFDITWARIK
jgi:hypothetical protein